MTAWPAIFRLALASFLAASASIAGAAENELRICLVDNMPPLSAHERGKPDSGFDIALAAAVAARLGRPLAIQWVESKLDEDSSPALEANALLSDHRCELVADYTLTKDGLSAPGFETAKLPGYEGATGPNHRRRVKLGRLAPSRPYLYAPLTIVLGPKAQGRRISRIGDLAGLHVGVESGTFADEILMTFDNGRLVDAITHLIPGRSDLLAGLENGDFDAALVDLRRLDAYRATHSDTKLAASGYYYPIGANRGYVGLASDPDLLAAVDKAIADLQAAGTIADLAKAAGLTYVAPREPAILGDVLVKDLQDR
jgi:ABC-type amino acid transport substrate-binding protein